MSIRKIVSLMLCAVIVFGCAASGMLLVNAASAIGISSEGIEFIKRAEGFISKPVWDYSQWTVGYGSRCPDDKLETYRANGITEKEANVLLMEHIASIERTIKVNLINKYKLRLTQQQYDALISFSYNVGPGWTSNPNSIIHTAVRSGAKDSELVRAFSIWCKAGGEMLPGLVKRRMREANMYLNGDYTTNTPTNIGYVYFEPNGGSIPYAIQGFIVGENPSPFYTPTYNGHVFMGWYTERIGGKKVTVLTKDLIGKTLYARWDTEDGIEINKISPLTIKVAGSDVNLREGPGLSYDIIGQLQCGYELVIVGVTSGNGYDWGKSDSGWICLKYTNYDEALENMQNGSNNDPENDPEENPDNPADPDDNGNTVQPDEGPDNNTDSGDNPTGGDNSNGDEDNNQTDNENSESNTDDANNPESPDDDDEQTETKKIYGTVKLSYGYLSVRSGPGMNCVIADQLFNGDRVEIFEQREVDAMIWGRIENGWICMDYVEINQAESDQNPSTDSQDKDDQSNLNDDDILGDIPIVGTQIVIQQIPLTEVKITGLWVYRRVGPGTSFTSIGKAYIGEVYEIRMIAESQGLLWGQYNGGWICLSLTDYNQSVDGGNNKEEPDNKEDGQQPNPADVWATVNIIGTVVNIDNLNLRVGPGTSYTKIGALPRGTEVVITKTAMVGSVMWGKTAQGWVHMGYVNKYILRTVTADSLCVRQDAGTNNGVVGYVYYGNKVKITEIKVVNGVQWGKIDKGWISLKYVK